ncbi:MAG TPA: hypothetical protein VIM07_04540 [Chitinophagaceae bacterium]
MADNIDEEHLDNPTNTQSKNPSEEITPTADTETINPNQETENMEVHKHPHHVTHKKKWGEYLLEFFMLFLAVFLGFMAENIRENNVERHREKEYIESLVKDVIADTANAGIVIRDFVYRQPYIDSVVENFDAMLHGNSEAFAKYAGKGWGSFADFNPSDGTMQQLKNAGGLRLIRNKKAVDSILHYDATIKLLNIESNHLTHDKYEGLYNTGGSYINYYKIDTLRKRYGANWFNYAGDLFSTTDLQKRLEFFMKLKYVQTGTYPWLRLLYGYKAQGTRLIELLTKEYHLENE